jgi:acetyl esterase/lipase
MASKHVRRLVTAFAVLVLAPGLAHGQLSESADWAISAGSDFRSIPNVTYLTANQWEGKLDIYVPRDGSAGPHPTFIYFHGGAHVFGSKEASFLTLLPYLEKGWAVVNVEYRLAPMAHAPAAVEDCLCAVRWVIQNGEEHGIDTSRLVLSGNSAGAHLALAAGMIPSSTGLDRQCPGAPIEVAGIVNWYGITDVLERLEGPHSKPGTVQWFGSNPDRRELAQFISPLTYVRDGLPPTITIHGDSDPRIPHTQAVRLHEGLERAGVPNQLITIPGGGHGGFKHDEMVRSYTAIWEFLGKHVSGQPSRASTSAP